jgi:hypothetical protein
MRFPKLRATERRRAAPVIRIAESAVLCALLVVGIMGAVSSAANPGAASLVRYGPSREQTTQASGAVRLAPDAAGGRLVTSFSITGSVAGLFPGKRLPLVLTVTNPEKVTITVTSISTTVGKASRGCLAANLKVTKFSGHLVVAAGKKAKATVEVTMAHSAPNACQGTHFPFHFSGLASAA